MEIPWNGEAAKHFSAFRKYNEEPDLPALLIFITTVGDDRLVTLTEEKAEELLTRQPAINTVLKKAWKEASFKEVRQLGAFFVARSRFFSL